MRAWRDRNAIYREGEAPDGSEELLVYQTLVGAWPIDAERMRACMEKALREEKTRTAWVDGDPEWEGQVFRFCDALLEDVAFTGDVTAFVAEIEPLADRTPSGSCSCRSPRRACRTSTTARRCRGARWSTPTTVGPWTSSCGAVITLAEERVTLPGVPALLERV